MWECEACSQPGAYRSADEGTHRFGCDIEGVKQIGPRLLVTYTSDPSADPHAVSGVAYPAEATEVPQVTNIPSYS